MKQRKKIYISLPITAVEQKAREKADLLKARLSREGWEVVNPFEIWAGEKPTYADHLCADLRAMMDCDAILFCHGWTASCGCNIERQVAIIMKTYRKKNFEILYEK